MDDVVDHAVQETSTIELKTIVDKKNEENAKISLEQTTLDNTITYVEPQSDIVTTEEELEIEETKAQAPVKPTLKYSAYYTDDMWSPINQTGRKVYSRNFLIKLQNDPHSIQKPSGLPDLEIILSNMSKRVNICTKLFFYIYKLAIN